MYKERLSVQAQTLFARMLTRKRTWYSVKDHLTNYGDFDALQPALKELAEAGFLLTPASLHVDLINQLKRAQGEILDE